MSQGTSSIFQMLLVLLLRVKVLKKDQNKKDIASTKQNIISVAIISFQMVTLTQV